MEFMQINSLFAPKICQSLFSFGIVGAKEKSYQKRKAPQMGGAAPPPRKLLEKLDQNFLLRGHLKFVHVTLRPHPHTP